MTTTATPAGATPGGRPMLVAFAVVTAVGLILAGIAAMAADRAAVYGAGLGLVLVLAFFGVGLVVVNFVSHLMPAAALLIALLTYTLQIVLFGVAFAVIRSSGLLDHDVDAAWLGGTMIVLTMVWLVGQLTVATRARIPAYDLTDRGAR